MDKKLEFQVKRIYRLNGNGNTKAFVDLMVSEALLIKGLRIVDSPTKGIFVSMPREQGKDSKWYDIVRPLNKEIKGEISSAVLSAYNNENKED